MLKVALAGLWRARMVGVLAWRRLSPPLVWRAVCPCCPSGWDGRDLTCTRRNECASRAWVPGCGGTGYPTSTWPDEVDPPQVTSASSLTSPAQPGFRLLLLLLLLLLLQQQHQQHPELYRW